MKERKQRRKAIPHCYKRTLSRTLSNTSLSQLVHLASYKKRINDLSRNNRQLAAALQESRVELANQSNLLKDCTRDRNYILFARLKLNEMAKNVAKFVTDLEEVRNYLNIDFPTDCNLFCQKKGSPTEKIIKIPTVNCIEEVSEFSSVLEETAAENISDIAKMTDLILPHESEDGNLDHLQNDMEDKNEENGIEIAPILFVDDTEVKKKSSCRSRCSKRSSEINKGSLTPELKIDSTGEKLKRSKSRRMTQFSFTETRTSKSTEKTKSSGKKSSDELVTPVRPVSSPLINHEQHSTKINNIEKETAEIHNNFQDKKGIDSDKIAYIINDSDSTPVINFPVNVEKTVDPVLNLTKTNHTVISCEDMELTEVINPIPEIVENSFPVSVQSINTGIIMPEKSRDNVIDNEKNNLKEIHKLSVDSQNSNLLHSNDVQLPEINEYCEEIQNVGMLTFCDPNNDDENKKRSTLSSHSKQSRAKKVIKYAVFFSSDESDNETPKKSAPSKKSNKKKNVASLSNELSKNTSLVAIDSIQKSVDKAVTKDSRNDYSVYNLDVSNSEKINKKTKKSLSQKSKQKKINKDSLPKPLFQKCSVTKLKAGSYKFSKSEKVNSNEVNNTNLVAPPFSPGGILKKSQSKISSVVKNEAETALNEVESAVNLNDSIVNVRRRPVLETPKSESKRVSFAPTDLVCNFRKMSESIKIANNKKMRRTSKSVLDFNELFEDVIEIDVPSHQGSDKSSESTRSPQLNTKECFNFSGDTELYTLTLAPKTHVSTVTTDDLLSSKPTISSFSHPTKITIVNDKIDLNAEKSFLTMKSTKDTGKLSLKRNKNPQKFELHSSDRLGKKLNPLLLESPVSVVKPAKRKSLFKETSEDDFKENINYHETPEDVFNTVQNSPLSSQKECSKKTSTGKHKKKASSKVSLKRNKLSDKPKFQLEPKKEIHLEAKFAEGSPILRDVLNVAAVCDDIHLKRRSKAVSYTEPKLNKKLRRE